MTILLICLSLNMYKTPSDGPGQVLSHLLILPVSWKNATIYSSSQVPSIQKPVNEYWFLLCSHSPDQTPLLTPCFLHLNIPPCLYGQQALLPMSPSVYFVALTLHYLLTMEWLVQCFSDTPRDPHCMQNRTELLSFWALFSNPKQGFPQFLFPTWGHLHISFLCFQGFGHWLLLFLSVDTNSSLYI